MTCLLAGLPMCMPLQVSKGDTVLMMNTGKEYTLDEVGVLAPGKTQVSAVDSVVEALHRAEGCMPVGVRGGHGMLGRCRLTGPRKSASIEASRDGTPRVLPAPTAQVDTLYCGEVGYLAAQIKSVQDARVGDTVTLKKSAVRACVHIHHG